MADDDEVFAEIRKHEQPKTHHECRCRDCDPITAMAERVDAFKAAKELLKDGPVGGKWHDEDPPSVREAMMLADWLLYGPSEGD